jgi:hypothetical protein
MLFFSRWFSHMAGMFAIASAREHSDAESFDPEPANDHAEIAPTSLDL